eukprot:3822434-Rhodomonas_salina.1
MRASYHLFSLTLLLARQPFSRLPALLFSNPFPRALFSTASTSSSTRGISCTAARASSASSTARAEA